MITISIIGPESTGKSVLAAALAAHYRGAWIPEYAREYVTLHPSEPTYEDVCRILSRDRSDLLHPASAGNLLVPESASSSTLVPESASSSTLISETASSSTLIPDATVGLQEPAIIFFDAGLIIDKVWSDVVFGRRPDWLTDASGAIAEALRTDYYLLLEPDIAWVDDPARSNGSDEARSHLFDLYRREIQQTGRPYGVVSGFGPDRTNNAIRLVDAFLKLLRD